METINHEYYVSLEVAKLLKKLGFNWAVKTYYRYLSPYDEYNLEFDSISTNYNHLNNADFSAPSLDVAQRWLREVKNIYVILQISDYEANGSVWDYNYRVGIHNINPIRSLYKYKSYEEAQEAGIKKVLEMILEKGE